MHLSPERLFLIGAMALSLSGCITDDRPAALFEPLDPKATGVAFVNDLPETPGLNILNFLYYYNGGGVAAGDIDNDGLPDLFFTSNLGPDRLYRNKGNYQFEDITETAGVAGPDGWTSGVTMADVNGDGWLDIYVSGVSYLTTHGRNVLWINNGDRTFTDRTKELGLEHVGYSTQAAFFDYDNDGDLDMYLLNYSVHTERGVSRAPQREPRHPRAGDKLFRNDPAPHGARHGRRFVDVSEQAGIYGGVEGYGLGVVASDFNLDGCIDIYVGNDFQENDFLYRNNCDGTFTESIASSVGHTSRFSMGVDAADFNNDGRPDIVSLDMLPEREEILKTSANAESFNVERIKRDAGYHAQYARNALQLNRGLGRFSEIGYLAGVYATDWSWAPLFADLDNDGNKDLFITSGIYRRPNDLDYINYVGNDAIQTQLARGVTEKENAALLSRMPKIPLASFVYRNNGDLTFTNVADAWGLGEPGFANGAAYVDLNNSGSLDLVVNRINAPAAIYRSHARERTGNRYLTVALRGSGANTAGIGAKVMIKHRGVVQLLEQMPTRGFQSSVDPRLHFGLGSADRIDSLVVIWPDHAFQVLTNVAANQLLTLAQKDAAGRYAYREGPASQPLFADVTRRSGVDFKHVENTFFDYNREPLMPHLLSTEGPALAAGDVDGDGLDDFYIGGGKWQAGRLYIQQRDGTFRASADRAFVADSLAEDVDAVFFDADGDRDLDLYVVSGGNEFAGNDAALRDRLYLNNGRGGFQRATAALPEFFQNGSCVVPGDFDGDGDADLFVGSRVVARAYGLAPRSYLLENDGTGRFTDVTAQKAEALAEVGLVASAAWTDTDGDRRLDLVVVGEWLPVTIFRQGTDGRFIDATSAAGLAGTTGWWNTVLATDLDRDGRSDLVLGNLGLNSYIRASRSEPARLYVHDFFHNGSLEQILTFYKHGVSYPLAGRDEFVRLMPQLRSKYVSYSSFGASKVEDILPGDQLREARVLEARLFASSVAINNGRGGFDLRPLPLEAQLAPVYASLAHDFDGDGEVDLLLGGNFYGVTPVRGQYDASYGMILRGTGDGRFEPADLEESNLVIEGQVRDMKLLRSAGGATFVAVARNDDTVRILRPLRSRAAIVARSRE